MNYGKVEEQRKRSTLERDERGIEKATRGDREGRKQSSGPDHEPSPVITYCLYTTARAYKRFTH